MPAGSPGLQPLIISPPFGNYFRCAPATRTLGTFTCYARRTLQWDGGLYCPQNERFWWLGMLKQAIKTIRYRPKLGGWTNRMGLRNPGIRRVFHKYSGTTYWHDKIVSVHGFTPAEWETVIDIALAMDPLALELNFSCPNVHTLGAVDDAMSVAARITRLAFARMPAPALPRIHTRTTCQTIIAKIPPVKAYQWAESILLLCPQAVLHMCNTVPVEYGGLSGREVKARALPAIRAVRRNFPYARIIGGGGVYSTKDIDDYLEAGVNHVAIGSVLFNPMHWLRPAKFARYLQERIPYACSSPQV